MPTTYTVTDPETGRKVKLTGDSPPTEAELTQVFARLNPATEPARTPGRPSGLATIGEVAAAKADTYGPDGYGSGYGDERGGWDVAKGIVKGAANTAVGLGEMVHRVPGVTRAVDAVYGEPGLSARTLPAARAAVQPTNTAQQVGFSAEQIGEFFTPLGAAGKVKAAAEVVKAALLTGAQGGTKGDVGISAGLSAVVPGAGAVRKAGRAIADAAEPLVRSAIKPTVASLRRITGQGGMDAKANALVRFIIDNRLTTPEKARTLFTQTEHELQRVLSTKNAPTDAATRAGRYLDALERSAAKQGIGGDDVAQIRDAAKQLLAGPMGETVGVDDAGNAIRAIRASVPAKEALNSARASSRWTTRKSWGEQKGATMEASKAVERAQRDAVKTVPGTRELLQKESKAIQSEQALDRMTQRMGNREPISPFDVTTAAVEIGTSGVPVMATARALLRENKLRAGMWADTLGKAIEKGNVPLVADILKRLGVGGASQAMTRATAP